MAADLSPSLASLPITSLDTLFGLTVIVVGLQYIITNYVAKHGSFPWAETLLEAHHFVAASLSLVLAAYVLDIGHDLVTARTGYKIDPPVLGYLYHLLKSYEHLDTLLSALSGDTRISKYTAFNHLALPFWSYLRIIVNPSDSTDWRLQVIADCTVRFLSRAVPWLVEDVSVEQTILGMTEEFRWYPDLAITAFWGLTCFQGQRDSVQAIKVFGPPRDNELFVRVTAAVILLFAGYYRRQEEAKKSLSRVPTSGTTTTTSLPEDTATKSTGTSIQPRHSSRRKR